MADVNGSRPRVLFVYYTHTNQAKRVCESMAEVLRSRGCEVSEAGIEFTDPHYAEELLDVSLQARSLQYPAATLAAAAPEDRADPDPGRS